MEVKNENVFIQQLNANYRQNVTKEHFNDLHEYLDVCVHENKGTIVTVSSKLTCQICSNSFRNSKFLKQHFNTHYPTLCYTCHVCWKTFPSSSFLEPHLKDHKTEELFSLMYHTHHPSIDRGEVYRMISKDLTDKGQLDGEWHYCNFCSTMVFDRIDTHLLKYHQCFLTDKAYKCFVCGEHFETAGDLKSHIQRFMYDRKITSNVITTFDNSDDRPVMENESNTNSSNSNEKLPTNNIVKDKTTPKYQCDICMKILASEFLLNFHIKKYHDPCMCGLETCSKCKLKRKQAAKYQCTICNKFFHSLHYLTKHLEKHSGPDQHKCDKCDQTFKFSQTLEYHVQSKHAKSICTCGEDMCDHCIKGLEKVLRCSICQKEFKKRQGLLRHEKLHKGELEQKQYCCEICGKIYTRHSSLHTHIQMVHKDPCRCGSCETCKLKNPKYQCEICRKIFISRHKLDRHTIIHSGERPHICEICGKSFNQVGNLFVHLKSHKRREQK